MDIHLFENTILNLPSPVQEIYHNSFIEADISVFIKRDDLIHPIISGNKWRKLREYIGLAKENSDLPLLSFGGAFSNHLYALAFVGNQFNISTIGIVRGDELSINSNPYLKQMNKWGMELHFVNRTHYKEKINPTLKKAIEIPEGGFGNLGIAGISELVAEINSINPSHIITAVGTGTTALGINKYWGKPVIGILTLNNLPEILTNEKNSMLINNIWKTDYIMGKYAKESDIINQFCESFVREHQIDIEPIYTGRMFYGLFDMISKKQFPKGSKILALHSGGIKLSN